MKRKESWQIAVLASAVCHCESNGCFTATESTTERSLYDVVKNNTFSAE